jgi:hypothetical protein
MLSDLLQVRRSEEDTFEHLRSQPSMSDFTGGVWCAPQALTLWAHG